MNFNYNRADAECRFCLRTENPHPDFNEPIVTQFFRSASNKNVEICINCYHELQELVKNSSHSFERIIDIKENFVRIMEKIQIKPDNSPSK
jgi:hypothetical protein